LARRAVVRPVGPRLCLCPRRAPQDGLPHAERCGGPSGRSASEPLTWEELWAVGRYDLGLSETEFWELTPYELSLLLDRREEAERRRDARIAVAVCHLLRPYLRAGVRI